MRLLFLCILLVWGCQSSGVPVSISSSIAWEIWDHRTVRPVMSSSVMCCMT